METHAKVAKIEAGNGGLLEVKAIKINNLKEGKALKAIIKKKEKDTESRNISQKWQKQSYWTAQPCLPICIYFLSLPFNCFSIKPPSPETRKNIPDRDNYAIARWKHGLVSEHAEEAEHLETASW